MSNPIRPWFRLSSIARPTAQGSTEPAQPRPTAATGPAAVTRPVAVAPPPPPPPPPRAPSPPKREVSPPPRQQTPPPRAPSPQRRAVVTPPPTPPPPKPAAQRSPPPPTKEVKEALVRIGDPPRKPLSPPEYPSARSMKPEPRTPPEPPKPKAPSPKLSPYSLPPPQLRSSPEDNVTTQKKVLTAEKASHVHEPKEHHHLHHGNKVAKKVPPSDSEDMATRVITIAGENKGAVMEILRSPRKGEPKHLAKTGQPRVLRSGSSSSSDEGEGKKTKNKGKMMSPNGTLPLKAFVNSNVQMINSSIVYNSTTTHHDPGVHLSLSRKPGNGFHVKEHANGYTS